MKLISILGSPSLRSRSTALLRHARSRLAPHASQDDEIVLRDLPGRALLQADFDDTAILDAIRKVLEAEVVVVATPIYKASYSGLLKTFLDLLPQEGLRDKTVLPLATGGSAAHLLALDYALKPVLSALGARDILDPVYATDAQLVAADGEYRVEPDIAARVDRALRRVLERAALRRAEAQADRARNDALAIPPRPGAELRWAL